MAMGASAQGGALGEAASAAPELQAGPLAGRASQAHAGDEQGDDGAPLGRRCLRCQDSAGCPGEQWSISSLLFAFLPPPVQPWQCALPCLHRDAGACYKELLHLLK